MRDRASATPRSAINSTNGATSNVSGINNNSNSNASSFTTKLQKRSVVSQDISWNGKPEKFPELKERVEGHFIQALMGHCVHPDFVQTYLEKEGEVIDEFPEFDLTEEQLRSDNRVMFGALKSIFRQGQVKRHLRSNEKTQDGMRAWSAIVQDRAVLIEQYETLLAVKYHRDYQGGLTGFIRDYEVSIVELEALSVMYEDSRRLSLLLRNLMIPGETEWMVAHCEDKFKNDFVQACRWLRSKDARREFYHTTHSKRHAHMAKTKTKHASPGLDVNHMAFYISQLSQPSLTHDALNSMRQALFTRNESTYIPPAIWNQLSQTSKQDILRAKLNLPRRNGGDSNTHEAPAMAPTEPIPTPVAPISFDKPTVHRQYEKRANAEEKRANLTNQQAAEQESSQDENEGDDADEDPSTESSFDILKKTFLAQRQGFISVTELQDESPLEELPVVHANMDYLDQIANLFTKEGTDTYYAVTDNGADTTVMGDGWLILDDTETAPRANLVGFDKAAKKKGLPIVAGAIKVTLDDCSEVILKVHQGVYNEGSRTTLISEFQVRDHGLIIDSISAKHRTDSDGRRGTQSFWVTKDQ